MIPRPWMKIRVKRQLCGCLRVCWLGTGDFLAGLTLGLEDLLDHDGHEAGVPVVGDEAHVLAVAKGSTMGAWSAAWQNMAKRSVVGVVGAVGLAVELGASLAPNLGEEGVVDEDAVDALLVLVEVADVVAESVDADGGIPGALVLVVAGAMVMTLWPRLASSTGSEPTTSPRPPVLDQGATSVEMKTIFMGRLAVGE